MEKCNERMELVLLHSYFVNETVSPYADASEFLHLCFF